MIIHKLIETAIDVDNPLDIYVGDSSANILRILSDRFEGKCMRSCYIVKVLAISKLSNCVIAQEGNNSYGKINVVFEVEAVSYSSGEIINGCLIKAKDPSGVIICESGPSSIYIAPHQYLTGLRVGQYISVRVGVAKYKIGTTKVSINAYPYLFNAKQYVYELPSAYKLTKNDHDMLSDILNRLKSEREQRDNIIAKNKKGWDFFNNLLYAWKTEQKPPSGVTIGNLDKVLKDDTLPAGFLSRDSRIDLSEDKFYIWKNAPTGDDVQIIRGADPKDILVYMFEDLINFLRTVREMVSVYDTEALMKSHKNVWLIFMKSKQTA